MRLIHFFESTDDSPRTRPNPLPSISADDPRFGQWFDRGEELISDYMKKQGIQYDRGKGFVQATNNMTSVQRVPLNKVIGTETMLDPRGSRAEQLPLFYLVDGNYMIADGNHRVATEFDNGATSVEGRVLNVDALEPRVAA